MKNKSIAGIPLQEITAVSGFMKEYGVEEYLGKVSSTTAVVIINSEAEEVQSEIIKLMDSIAIRKDLEATQVFINTSSTTIRAVKINSIATGEILSVIVFVASEGLSLDAY